MKLLKILGVLSIAGISALCFFTNFSGDDYCFKSELANQSVLGFAFKQYMNWDGRSLSVAFILSLAFLKYLSVKYITLLWTICFICTIYFIIKILQIENKFFNEERNWLLFFSILSAIMWLGMWKLISDTIYWATGGAYSFENLSGVIWLYCFLKVAHIGKFNLGKNVFMFFLSFFIGVTVHNLVVGLITFCLIELCHKLFIKRERVEYIYALFTLIGLLSGAFVVFFAPGNSIRLSVLPHTGFSLELFHFYFLILLKYLYWLWPLLVLCLLVLWLFGNNIFSFIKNLFLSVWKKQFWLLTVYEHKYLITALSTILVFSVAHSFAVPRTSVFFGTFLVIYIFQKGFTGFRNQYTKKFIYSAVCFFGMFLSIIIFEAVKAQALNEKLKKREQVFAERKGKDAVVTPINKNEIPFAFSFTDISSDSTFWVNIYVAKYFNLKTVRTGSN